jgi:hypothetical protein
MVECLAVFSTITRRSTAQRGINQNGLEGKKEQAVAWQIPESA